MHFVNASFSIKLQPSAIIALGSLANWNAVGIKRSLTKCGSLNTAYSSEYRSSKSNALARTLAHELFRLFTKKLNNPLDSSKLTWQEVNRLEDF